MQTDRRPTLFLAARATLEPILAAGGFDLALEHYDYVTTGSAFAEYRRRGGRVRLIWEGKGAALWAEAAPSQLDHWRELEHPALARASTAPDEGATRIAQLASVLQRLAAEPAGRA